MLEQRSPLLKQTKTYERTCDFAVTGPQMWNDLPLDVWESPSPETCTGTVKTVLWHPRAMTRTHPYGGGRGTLV